MRINPYRPGAGLVPAYLAGRENTIQEAEQVLESIKAGFADRSIIYYGLRGVGKTVLLNKIEFIADEIGIPSEYIEISEQKNTFKQDIALYIYKLLNRVSTKNWIEKFGGKSLGILKAFSIRYSMDEQALEIGYDPVKGIADTGNFQNDITELFLLVGNAAAQNEQGVIFFIDEVQYMQDSDLEALIKALHRTNQKGYPLAIFVAGLPKITKIAGDIKSYAERLFRFVEIDSLDEKAARLALTEPAKKFHVKYNEDAVRKIVDITEGYPYFLQEYGKWVWDARAGKDVITTDIADEAYKKFEESLDKAFFKVRYDRATPREIDFMLAMVKCGTLPCSTKDVASAMGVSPQQISALRAQLIHKGFIYAVERGQIDFTVPQFDRYMLRTL